MTGLPTSPHRRFDPLRGEWVVVSAHRASRPWQGQVEDAPPPVTSHDPTCFLCPGNTRTNGAVNPSYTYTWSFPNDFPALLASPDHQETTDGLLQTQPVSGQCEVLCYSPDHSKTLATLPVSSVEKVIDLWCETAARLGEQFAWVQIFENRGASMGMSSPHPHGQVWAMSEVPTLVQTEDRNQLAHFQKRRSPLLLDYVKQELEAETRIVEQNEDWVWLVPFWAVWPFEVMLLPTKHTPNLAALTGTQKHNLAEILTKGLSRYDRLFNTSFPYSMGWHFAPFKQESAHWQLHAHFYPPLLRSASVRKFMVGFEMLAEAQRDITPEQAAERLRNV